MPIHFGTDGWRGRIAEDYTFGNVRRCTQGFATYLRSKGWGGEAVARMLLDHAIRVGAQLPG